MVKGRGSRVESLGSRNFSEHGGGDLHVGAAELMDADSDIVGLAASDAHYLSHDVFGPSDEGDLLSDGEA